MSQKPNPTAIGLFLILGTALLALGVVLFSSGRWFEPKVECILYFDASVKGLSPGAAVKFRGVTVGAVREILIHSNQAPEDLHMPVIIEINIDQVGRKSDRTLDLTDPNWCDAEVAKGLRGMLASDSLVTGQLYIELEVLRDAPPPVFHQVEKRMPEIPTVPTNIQVLLDNLARLDLNPMVDRLNDILTRLDALIASVPMGDISRSLTNLLDAATTVATHPDLTNTLTSARSALQRIERMADSVDRQVVLLSERTDRPLAEAADTLAEFRAAALEVRTLLAADAPLRTDLLHALDELSRAARAISDLADSLNRNPDALLKGRRIMPARP